MNKGRDLARDHPTWLVLRHNYRLTIRAMVGVCICVCVSVFVCVCVCICVCLCVCVYVWYIAHSGE